jgi:hypothetical protein
MPKAISIIVTVFWLLGNLHAGVVSGSRAMASPITDKSGIIVQIGLAGYGQDNLMPYPVGKPILISCSIINSGNKRILFKLKDHDAYQGTLPYPIEVCVQITREDGSIVTDNPIDKSGKGWWSQYYQWSTTFSPEMPGDVIAIPPRGCVVRKIPIDQVIMMAPLLGNGLTEGSYILRLRINTLISNPLTIRIGPGK